MLNCLGRSGSTWVTHLLGQHPEIITYGSFQLEPRLAGYWMDVLGTLAEPASYTQALQPEVTGDEWWIGKNRRTTLSLEPIDPDLTAWLGGSAIESLAAFCMGRVEAFYQRAAESQGKKGARFFAERSYGVGTFAPQIVRELYAGAREVFLVRDFRDVFSSMRAFKGSSLPRRHLAKSDAEYVRNQLREYVAGLYRSWQAQKDSAFLLRYEDLVRHPKETLTSLLEFIGVEAGPLIVERVIASARMVRSDRQDRHKTTTDPLSSVGRWVRELEPDVRQAFEERYVDILSEFGYSIDVVETAEPVP
ncbi:MAG: sulfotransferase family protein [Gammaproteobacteria bacterium]